MKKQHIKASTVAIVIIAVAILAAVIFYSNFASQDISEVKNPENVGDMVRVKGEVKSVIKIGPLSGYTLEDESGTIAVSSENLPKEGSIITVRGTLIRDTIFGYYIKAD